MRNVVSNPRKGDKVRITKGKYAGTVGTFDPHAGVYTEGVGYTGNVHPGRNIEVVASNTPDVNVENGRTIPVRQKSQAYKEWERLVASEPTDAEIDAYNKRWKSEAEVGIENRGLGRLLFGKRDDRFLWKRRA